MCNDNAQLPEHVRKNKAMWEAISTYRSEEENEWARHWPMENIWKLRKERETL